MSPVRSLQALLLLIPALPLQGISLSPDVLPEGAWRYEIRVRGQPAGSMEARTERRGDALESSSVSVAGDRQESIVFMDGATLRPIWSRTILASAEGHRFEAEMVYSTRPESLEVHRRVREQTAPADRFPAETTWRLPSGAAFDLAELDLVIAALPLAEGARWEVRLLDPTADSPLSVSIRVIGSMRREVPAGHYDVWRVMVTGQALAVTYDIDAATRVLVAQQIPSQGVEILLTGALPPKVGSDRSGGLSGLRP